MSAVRDRLRRAPIILDGAMGTELARRGVPTDLPLWSAAAILTHLDVIEAIHRDYAAAGADILVANTFRTNPRTLSRARLAERGPELNRLAIEAARRGAEFSNLKSEIAETTAEYSVPKPSASARRILVAASIAPVEDCYRADLVPDESTLDREHEQMIEWLVPAAPDLLWIETINAVREGRAAARAAHAAGLDFAISFVTNEYADLLSGESLSSAVDAILPFWPVAIGLNCIPPAGMMRCLPHLVRLAEPAHLPVSAYAHIGNPNPINGWTYSESMPPGEYAAHMRRWLELGATIVGGCCGTTPAHIACALQWEPANRARRL